MRSVAAVPGKKESPMAFDLFNRSFRSSSDGSVLAQTATKFCGRNWREESPDNHYELATIESAFAEPCFQGMETRLLLDVIDDVSAQYPGLNLSGSYNIIEIAASQLSSDAALRNAITTAGSTLQNDLIVVRTTATQNKITLNGTELTTNIDVATRGSVTIVSLGPVPLTIDAQQGSRVLNISNANANISLAGLTIINGLVEGDGGGI